MIITIIIIKYQELFNKYASDCCIKQKIMTLYF